MSKRTKKNIKKKREPETLNEAIDHVGKLFSKDKKREPETLNEAVMAVANLMPVGVGGLTSNPIKRFEASLQELLAPPPELDEQSDDISHFFDPEKAKAQVRKAARELERSNRGGARGVLEAMVGAVEQHIQNAEAQRRAGRPAGEAQTAKELMAFIGRLEQFLSKEGLLEASSGDKSDIYRRKLDSFYRMASALASELRSGKNVSGYISDLRSKFKSLEPELDAAVAKGDYAAQKADTDRAASFRKQRQQRLAQKRRDDAKRRLAQIGGDDQGGEGEATKVAKPGKGGTPKKPELYRTIQAEPTKKDDRFTSKTRVVKKKS